MEGVADQLLPFTVRRLNFDGGVNRGIRGTRATFQSFYISPCQELAHRLVLGTKTSTLKSGPRPGLGLTRLDGQDASWHVSVISAWSPPLLAKTELLDKARMAKRPRNWLLEVFNMLNRSSPQISQ